MLPVPADARVIHAASIADLGGVVAGAFANAEVVGRGSYLCSASTLMSFDDFAATLRSQGHEIAILEVPPATGSLTPISGRIRTSRLPQVEG